MWFISALASSSCFEGGISRLTNGAVRWFHWLSRLFQELDRQLQTRNFLHGVVNVTHWRKKKVQEAENFSIKRKKWGQWDSAWVNASTFFCLFSLPKNQKDSISWCKQMTDTLSKHKRLCWKLLKLLTEQ